jgi:predicted enzyme related to lactoylglutathione lyase
MFGRTDWFDLPVADIADAMSFYEGLLGWKYQQMEDSALSDYVMIEAGGKLIGGLRRVSHAVIPADRKRESSVVSATRATGSPITASGMTSWGPILYFTVEKLAPKTTRAKELGAEIVGQTVDLGKDRGRYQWIRDREGHLIGLWGSE